MVTRKVRKTWNEKNGHIKMGRYMYTSSFPAKILITFVFSEKYALYLLLCNIFVLLHDC